MTADRFLGDGGRPPGTCFAWSSKFPRLFSAPARPGWWKAWIVGGEGAVEGDAFLGCCQGVLMPAPPAGSFTEVRQRSGKAELVGGWITGGEGAVDADGFLCCRQCLLVLAHLAELVAEVVQLCGEAGVVGGWVVGGEGAVEADGFRAAVSASEYQVLSWTLRVPSAVARSAWWAAGLSAARVR